MPMEYSGNLSVSTETFELYGFLFNGVAVFVTCY